MNGNIITNFEPVDTESPMVGFVGRGGVKLPDFSAGLKYRVEEKLRKDTPHIKIMPQ